MQFGHRQRSLLLGHDNEEKLQERVHTPASERGRRTEARILARFTEPAGTDRPEFWVFQKNGVGTCIFMTVGTPTTLSMNHTLTGTDTAEGVLLKV